MLKIGELKGQTKEELEVKYDELCREVYELTCELRINRKLEKPHLLREKKKDRARVLTVLREQQN